MKPSSSRQEKAKRDAERDRLTQYARDAGRYSLEEAAEELAQQTGQRVSTMQDALERAAFERRLPVYKPGSIVRYEYPDAPGSNVLGYVGHELEAIHAKPKLSDNADTRWSEEVYWNDLNTWLEKDEKHITWRFPDPAAKMKTVHGISPSDGDWKAQARAIADECFDADTNGNTRDRLIRKNPKGEPTGGYAYRVMEEMQKRKINGPRGLIKNAATISRDALQGKKWWANKPK
jgi:hypothetical protein